MHDPDVGRSEMFSDNQKATEIGGQRLRMEMVSVKIAEVDRVLISL